MMALLKPMKLDKDKLAKLKSSFAEQNPNIGQFNPSNDPEHYPVFRTPSQGLYLMYIPNHFMVNEEDERVLRADHVFTHFVNDGSRYGTQVRCVQGIHLGDELDGTCPLCEGAQISWDWYNTKMDQACTIQGRDLKKADDEGAKALRSSLLRAKPVGSATERLVFPAVIIDVDSKRKPLVKDGKLSYRIVFINWSVNQMEKIMKSIVDEDSCPAGRVFYLNYNYDTKGKEPNARDAAREMSVIWAADPNSVGLTPEHLSEFDKRTEDWDEAKSMEMVKDAMPYPVSQLESLMLGVVAPAQNEMKQITSVTTSVREGGTQKELTGTSLDDYEDVTYI